MSKKTANYPDLSAEQLFEMVEDAACDKTDGHFTLMRFTGGWKAMFQTPDVVGGGFPGTERECEYDRILRTPMEETMGDAIIAALYYLAHPNVDPMKRKEKANE
ncbi:MAG: hypothetical protein NUV80_03160 [Candidatus Berkelbacteria bacterium]|nr:hypothetical protein [Candidatus Berkelbacteria bacterium]